MRSYLDAETRHHDLATWNSFPWPKRNDWMLTDSRWRSTNKLLCQEWFSHSWVVREVALAQSGLVVWGQCEFQWNDLVRSAVWAVLRLNVLPDCYQIFASHVYSCAIENGRHLRVLGEQRRLQSLDFLELLSYRTLRFTDPQDRIYAFLDFADRSTCKLDLKPNYNPDPPEVFRNSATQYINLRK